MSIETRMRDLEYFSHNSVPPNMWTILRLDGNKFSKFTKEQNFKKPFDSQFRDYMLETASYVLENMGGIFGITHSDEISLLFPRDWCLFNKRAEKIVSISAGMASSKFSTLTNSLIQFDSRVWMAATDAEVIEYFKWRQMDSYRNAIHGYCFYKLLEEGKTISQATSELDGKNNTWKNEFLFQRNINFNEVPSWEKRGVGIIWETYQKEGKNPITGETVLASRRRIGFDFELPMKEGFEDYVAMKLATKGKY